jgi:hypothetical protein
MVMHRITNAAMTEIPKNAKCANTTSTRIARKEIQSMRYMGGKFRQSKAIVQCLRPYFNENTMYVEPFCGGMWSACRVIDELHPKSVILNDINKPLMLLWDKCIKDGVDWLPTDSEVVEREYQNYRLVQDENDPLTAWYGIALSFGGKWFGGVARNSKDDHTHTGILQNASLCIRKSMR